MTPARYVTMAEDRMHKPGQADAAGVPRADAAGDYMDFFSSTHRNLEPVVLADHGVMWPASWTREHAERWRAEHGLVKADPNLCRCGHVRTDHEGGPATACMVPGCGCDAFTEREPED